MKRKAPTPAKARRPSGEAHPLQAQILLHREALRKMKEGAQSAKPDRPVDEELLSEH